VFLDYSLDKFFVVNPNKTTMVWECSSTKEK
jgi:hypothetical protein